jgi:transmembrane sensor
MAAATSWRQGKLIFDDEPLVSALARMQRYSRLEVTLGDPALADIRVSGVFNAGDMSAFVGAVETYFPVTVVREGSDALRIVPRG